MSDLWSEHGQIHVPTVKTSSFWKVPNSSADADLIMQIINHLVGDGVVQNAACRPDDEMILKAGVGHHSRKTINASPALERSEIKRILERHHPGLLLHRGIYDGSAASGLSKTHAASLTRSGAKDEAGEGQQQHNWQPDQVKPMPPFKPCIKIQNHNDLRLCVSLRLRPDRARC